MLSTDVCVVDNLLEEHRFVSNFTEKNLNRNRKMEEINGMLQFPKEKFFLNTLS